MTTPTLSPIARLLLPLEKPANVRRIVFALALLCFGLVLFDLAARVFHWREHAQGFAGWIGLYGFVMCVFLVLSAKALRRFLFRPENYYDPKDSHD